MLKILGKKTNLIFIYQWHVPPVRNVTKSDKDFPSCIYMNFASFGKQCIWHFVKKNYEYITTIVFRWDIAYIYYICHEDYPYSATATWLTH